MPEQTKMELSERELDVLSVLVDGRANPLLIREETGLPSGEVNTVLVRLGRRGLAKRLTRGLYEITGDGATAFGDARE